MDVQREIPLTLRLTLALLAPAALVMGAGWLALERGGFSSADREAALRMDSFARALAEHSAQLLAKGGSFESLDAVLQIQLKSGTHGDVQMIQVLDPKGKMLASAGSPTFLEGLYFIRQPIRGAGRESLGWVQLGFSRRTLGEELAAEARERLLVFFSSGLAAMLLLTYLLVRSAVIEPIRRLNRQSSRLRRGLLHHLSASGRPDEIGQLARRFELLVSELQRLRDGGKRSPESAPKE